MVVILDNPKEPFLGDLAGNSVISRVDGRPVPDVESFREALEAGVKRVRAAGERFLRLDIWKPEAYFTTEKTGFLLIPIH